MKPKRCQRPRNAISFKEEEPFHHFRPAGGRRIAEVMYSSVRARGATALP